MTVIRLNRLHCLEGRATVLESRLGKVQKAARLEPGCLLYRWLRVEGALEYVGISEWIDNEAWSRHLKAAAFAEFFALEQQNPCLAAPPEHLSLNNIGV